MFRERAVLRWWACQAHNHPARHSVEAWVAVTIRADAFVMPAFIAPRDYPCRMNCDCPHTIFKEGGRTEFRIFRSFSKSFWSGGLENSRRAAPDVAHRLWTWHGPGRTLSSSENEMEVPFAGWSFPPMSGISRGKFVVNHKHRPFR